MPTRCLAATLAATLLTISAAHALDTTLQLQLSTTGDFERRTLQYDCGTETPLQVSYLNAAPNFIAILTVPDQTEPLLFASVISASGARYASGQWVWWNAGPEGSLYDTTLGDDAEAVLTCSEINNTP